MKSQSRILLFTLVLVVLATGSKLLFAPKIEWSGFSPIMAIALFSGMIVKDKSRSFLYPLIALFLSDVLVQVFYTMGLFPFAGLYSYQWFNYSLILLITLIGWVLKGKNYSRIITGVVAGPTLFYLISNIAVWAGHGGWGRPMNFSGFLLCMQDGLPFYKNSLIATIFYLPVVMISYNALVKKSYSLKLS